MANLTLYGLKNCDTCKKALTALKDISTDVRFVDIRTQTDLSAKIPTWLASIDPEQIVNKRSTTWRGLTKTQQAEATTSKVKELLIANPTLIKRPVIETNQAVYVGWTKEVQEALT